MIDVYTDKPRSRYEELLFELIKKLKENKIYEVFGETTLTGTPSPEHPVSFENVVYNKTQTGRGTVLRGIGDYKDKIVVNQKTRTAYIERKIGVMEFDGTEAWIYYNPVQAGHGLSFALTMGAAKIGHLTTLCNYFEYVVDAWAPQYIDRTGIYTDHGSAQERFFRKPNADTITLEAWKSWLAERKTAGNPVIVYYKLLTPTTEEIPYIG